jgi:hypothetical protein
VGGVGFKLQNFLFRINSLENVKNKIVNYLDDDRHKQQYIVILDDLDRLEKNEILEVAKLSRVIADFPNTFYIIPYDREYIDTTLYEKGNTQSLPKTYFDKIIQLEFKLPKTTNRDLATYFAQIIISNKGFIQKCDRSLTIESLEVQINELKELNLFEHFTPTLRDVKRFVNSFLLKYQSLRIKHNVKFKHILLFDFIFYRNKDDYEKLYRLKSEIPINGIGEFNPSDQKVRDIVALVLKDLKPNNKGELLNAYFSYLENRSFTTGDREYLFQTPNKEDVIKEYAKENLFKEAFISITEKHYDDAKFKQPYFGNITHYQNFIRHFWEAYRKNTAIVPFEQITEIGDYCAVLWQKMDADLNQQNLNENKTRVQLFRDFIKSFKVKYIIYKYNENEKSIILKTTPSPNMLLLPEMDDCIYNKVFNIGEYTYKFTFESPSVIHWRLGFRFSVDESFTINRFRLGNQSPLFHIGRDHGSGSNRDTDNIMLTCYDGDGNLIVDENLKKVQFKPINKLSIEISTTKDTGKVMITLSHGVESIYIHTINWNKYKYFKLLAWADNDQINQESPYKFVVDILESPANKGVPHDTLSSLNK